MNWANIPNLQHSGEAYGFRQMAAGNCWLAGAHGLQNSLNPIDHPWNFDTATVAKSRLREIVRADRKACPVSHWVATSTYSVRPSRILIPGTYVYLITDARKRHYRWERRS